MPRRERRVPTVYSDPWSDSVLVFRDPETHILHPVRSEDHGARCWANRASAKTLEAVVGLRGLCCYAARPRQPQVRAGSDRLFFAPRNLVGLVPLVHPNGQEAIHADGFLQLLLKHERGLWVIQQILLRIF